MHVVRAKRFERYSSFPSCGFPPCLDKAVDYFGFRWKKWCDFLFLVRLPEEYWRGAYDPWEFLQTSAKRPGSEDVSRKMRRSPRKLLMREGGDEEKEEGEERRKRRERRKRMERNKGAEFDPRTLAPLIEKSRGRRRGRGDGARDGGGRSKECWRRTKEDSMRIFEGIRSRGAEGGQHPK